MDPDSIANLAPVEASPSQTITLVPPTAAYPSSQLLSPLQWVADAACIVFDDGNTVYGCVPNTPPLPTWTIPAVYQLNGWTLFGTDLYVQDGCVTSHYDVSSLVLQASAIPDDAFNFNLGQAFSTQLMNGLSSCTVGTGGSGYLAQDVLSVSGGTGGQVTVDTVDENGAVTGLTISAAGNGYSPGTTNQTTGGLGSGATVSVSSVV